MTTTVEFAHHGHRDTTGRPRLLAGVGSDLRRHERQHGPVPHRGVDLVDATAAAGLTGRGGAAFPVARKLAAAAAAVRNGPAVVIANGAEGEPLSRKDAVLLHDAPHLVLDGLAVVADAVGADTGYLCVPADQVPAMTALIDERRGHGWDARTVRVVATPGRFVDGETTALVDLVSGGAGVPRDRRVPTAVHGVDGRPTVVHNVETLAHLALIARNGSSWFRGRGTAAEPGTALVTLSGPPRHGAPPAVRGVLEADLGTPLAVLLRRVDVDPSELRAVLIGGFHGTWVDGRAVPRLAMSAQSLTAVGATPGAGVFRFLRPTECGLAATAHIVDHLAGESAGQCGPCRFGLPALAAAMSEVVAGGGETSARRVESLARAVDRRGACAHPDGTARMVRSALTVFGDDIDAHEHGLCLAGCRP